MTLHGHFPAMVSSRLQPSPEFFMPKNAKSPKSAEAEKPLTKGLSVNKEQTAALITFGLKDYDIYQIGRGAETLAHCLSTYRGRPGELIVAADLRVLGNSRKDLLDVMADLHRRKIIVRDIENVEDLDNPGEMIRRALKAISSARFMNNRRGAKRVGRRGGKAKGVAEWNKRDEIAPRWLIQNMVAMFGAVKTAAALDNKISASTLRRQYVASTQA